MLQKVFETLWQDGQIDGSVVTKGYTTLYIAYNNDLYQVKLRHGECYSITKF